jgi:hypothetical protein
MARSDLMSPEEWFASKAFLWNRWSPFFPPFVIFDKIYTLEKVFPRYDHCFNGGDFLGWIARYDKV